MSRAALGQHVHPKQIVNATRRKIDMSDNFHSLIKEHHAFYEVVPYYLLFEERHGSSSARTRRVQAGFDVEIYGVKH
jgi:hypothetical protein